MALSVATDYARDTGDPSPYLERIATAGFSHVHWCHQWNTDFFYTEPEIAQIEQWLGETGLKLLDLHASHGVEKSWASEIEFQRLAGVELVKNRLSMTARLGGGAIVIHIPRGDTDPVRRSLDALLPVAQACRVKIAIENLTDDDFGTMAALFAAYPSDMLGLCYDSGHGNMGEGRGLDRLEEHRDRLIAVHLHDNDGRADRHDLPFTGTLDWRRLAGIVAASAYEKCVSLEVGIGGTGMAEGEFLENAFSAAGRLAEMIDGVLPERNC